MVDQTSQFMSPSRDILELSESPPSEILTWSSSLFVLSWQSLVLDWPRANVNKSDTCSLPSILESIPFCQEWSDSSPCQHDTRFCHFPCMSIYFVLLVSIVASPEGSMFCYRSSCIQWHFNVPSFFHLCWLFISYNCLPLAQSPKTKWFKTQLGTCCIAWLHRWFCSDFPFGKCNFRQSSTTG